MHEQLVHVNGEDFLLKRLEMSPEEWAALLSAGVFDNALRQLQVLQHEQLRGVIDGGMQEDQEDHGELWLRTRVLEGERLGDAKLEEREIKDLGMQCQNLMGDLGELASAVSFDPAQIGIIRLAGGEVRAFFEVDYLRWFRNAARGIPYWEGQNEAGAVRRLLEGLVVQQLRPPKKKRDEKPIPFVEDRSPALRAYESPREGKMLSLLSWLGLILALWVIIWLTSVGMTRMEENPRKEGRAWNAPDR